MQKPHKSIPTGCPELDSVDVMDLGFPLNRVSYVAGAPGVGKTTFVCHTIHACINAGLHVYWADWENRQRYKAPERLTFAQEPGHIDVIDAANGPYDVLVLDGLQLLPGPSAAKVRTHLNTAARHGKTIILTWNMRREVFDISQDWLSIAGQVILLTRGGGEPKVYASVYRESSGVSLPCFSTEVGNLEWLGDYSFIKHQPCG